MAYRYASWDPRNRGQLVTPRPGALVDADRWDLRMAYSDAH